MLTHELHRLLKEVDSGHMFLPLADWIEVMRYGNSGHFVLKFSGPYNNTVERAEACPIVCERDFGRLALFFLAVAIRSGSLGDTRLAIMELLNGENKSKSRERNVEEVLSQSKTSSDHVKL